MADYCKRPRPPLVIFTDLDGTLLDDCTYDFSPALPALNVIRSLGIPLVLVSSKTRAEMEFFKRKLSVDSPFIAENGGGIFFPSDLVLPKGYTPVPVDDYNALFVGRPINEVLARSEALKKRFDYKGFSEMSVSEIASITGLSLEQAFLASKREFDEPIILESPADDEESFLKEASRLGLSCVRGGRFFHLFSGGDKGKAVEIVLAVYRDLYGPFVSIALGDSPNDISMLEAADKAVLMRGRDGAYMSDPINSSLIKAKGGGPEAWNEVMLNILKNF